jgi:hypothetical protein
LIVHEISDGIGLDSHRLGKTVPPVEFRSHFLIKLMFTTYDQ